MHSISSLTLSKETAWAYGPLLTPEIVRHISLPFFKRELVTFEPTGFVEVLNEAYVPPVLCSIIFLTNVLGDANSMCEADKKGTEKAVIYFD